MVAVLCALLAIDVTLSALLYAIDDHNLVGTTLSNVDICVVYYVKYDDIYLLVKQCESICNRLVLCR